MSENSWTSDLSSAINHPVLQPDLSHPKALPFTTEKAKLRTLHRLQNHWQRNAHFKKIRSHSCIYWYIFHSQLAALLLMHSLHPLFTFWKAVNWVWTTAFPVFKSDVSLCLNNGLESCFLRSLRSHGNKKLPTVLSQAFREQISRMARQKRKKDHWTWSEPCIWDPVSSCLCSRSESCLSFPLDAGVVWRWHKGAPLGDCQLFLRWQD